jgi:hypothetical protein
MDCLAVAHGTRPGGVCFGTLPSFKTRIALTARGGSDEHGVASITFGLHETVVAIRLRGPATGRGRAAFLRLGGCWGRSVLFALGRVVHGERVARVGPVPRVTGISVVVRTHTRDGDAVVACGAIPPS